MTIAVAILFCSTLFPDNITVSQDTLLQTLNYGEVVNRTITLGNNTANDVNMTITLVDQTWIPLGRSDEHDGLGFPDIDADRGFVPDQICGTPDPTVEQVLVTAHQVEEWLSHQNRDSRSIINVQIAWHVIHAANGTGSLSYNQIADQVNWLNNAYAEYDFVFTLASVDYTANDDWFYNMWSMDSQVKSQLYIDPYHHMNVYTASIFSEGVAGYAYLPNQWPEGSYNHGIVLDYRTLPYAGGYDGDVATHEAGHYLGLNHTFLGNCSEPNDGVADTPANHEDYLWQCNNSLDSCPSMDGNDPVHNYMTYTSNSCQWEFTPGQKDRMHAMISQYRPSLLENPVAPSWLTTPTETVTVPANGILDVNLTFDATSIFGGTYYGDAIFSATTPDTSLIVSSTLVVVGIPELGVESNSVLFSGSYVNDTSFVDFEISNTGSDQLDISQIELDSDYFLTESSSLSIQPGESTGLQLAFIPDSVGSFTGNMTIQSNDGNNPQQNISLIGEGISSPLLFSFMSLSDTLEPNSYNSHLLTLTNSGSEDITYDIIHDINWLTIDNESGSIPGGNTGLIQLNINTLFMNYGDYSGELIVSTNLGQFIIQINITVIALGIQEEFGGIPQQFTVHKNYPNPFNPITTINIDIPEGGYLDVSVFDISGRLIKTLSALPASPGYYQFIWEGENELGASVSSGVYILSVQLNDHHQSQKMLLVK